MQSKLKYNFLVYLFLIGYVAVLGMISCFKHNISTYFANLIVALTGYRMDVKRPLNV